LSTDTTHTRLIVNVDRVPAQVTHAAIVGRAVAAGNGAI